MESMNASRPRSVPGFGRGTRIVQIVRQYTPSRGGLEDVVSNLSRSLVDRGFAVRVVFACVEYAGELIGLQMGLNFSGFFDPTTNNQTSATGRFFGNISQFIGCRHVVYGGIRHHDRPSARQRQRYADHPVPGGRFR